MGQAATCPCSKASKSKDKSVIPAPRMRAKAAPDVAAPPTAVGSIPSSSLYGLKIGVPDLAPLDQSQIQTLAEQAGQFPPMAPMVAQAQPWQQAQQQFVGQSMPSDWQSAMAYQSQQPLLGYPQDMMPTQASLYQVTGPSSAAVGSWTGQQSYDSSSSWSYGQPSPIMSQMQPQYASSPQPMLPAQYSSSQWQGGMNQGLGNAGIPQMISGGMPMQLLDQARIVRAGDSPAAPNRGAAVPNGAGAAALALTPIEGEPAISSSVETTPGIAAAGPPQRPA